MDKAPSYELFETRDEKGIKFIPKEAGFEYLEQFAFTPIFRYICIQNKSEEEAVSKYFNNRNYAEIYTMVFTLSTQKGEYRYVSDLYEFQKESLKGWMENTYTRFFVSMPDDEFMNQYNFLWSRFNQVLKAWWSKFFIYLDFSYIPNRKDLGIQKIEDQLQNQFHTHIYQKVKIRLLSILMNRLNRERDEESEERIHDLVSYFSNFNIEFLGTRGIKNMYHIDLEPYLWESSKEYYDMKAREWKHSMSNMDYISRVLEFQDHERSLQNKYLLESSKEQLKQLNIESFIVHYKTDILSDSMEGIAPLMDSKNYVNINRMFDFLAQIPKNEGLIEFAKTFRQYVVEDFEKMIDSICMTTEPKTWNQALCHSIIQKMNEMDEVVKTKMGNHCLLRKSFMDAMTHIINHEYNIRETVIQMTEYFAIFYDDLAKKMNFDEEMRVLLDSIAHVVSYMREKDLYLEHYRQLLARRILNKKTKDAEMDMYFLMLLKSMVGHYSIARLQGMISDEIKSKEQTQDYMISEKPFRTYFEPTNISFGHWPRLPNTMIHLPAAIRVCIQHYESYYGETHAGMRAEPIYSYGSTVINMQYPKKSYDFMMNIPQATVFYQFMGHLNEKTYGEIRSETQLSDTFLKRVLHSFSCNRTLRILHKTPESNTIQETDTFRLNIDFNSPNRMISIPCAIFDENNASKKVSEDRTHEIQASIIRIMKARRTLKHSDLMTQVVNQLSVRFVPSVQLIKKNIGVLIEKEYIERDLSDQALYKYIT